MSETKKPDNVAILTAIKPDNAGTGQSELRYSELAARDEQYSADLQTYWDELEGAEPGSPEEVKAGENLAKLFLIKTAMKIVSVDTEMGRDQALWNERYTLASGELYGQPDQDFVLSALQSDKQTYLEAPSRTPEIDELLSFYDKFLPQTEGAEERESGSLEAITGATEKAAEFLQAEYGEWLNLIDADHSYTPQEIAALIKEDLLPWLEEHSAVSESIRSGLGEWNVQLESNMTMIRVDPSDREIIVGVERAPQQGRALKATLAHEILGHAARGNNGSYIGPEFATGLGGYETFEEGFGVFLESAIGGSIPDLHKSRYLDIALAIGFEGQPQPSPTELARMHYLRKIVENQQLGSELTPAENDQAIRDSRIHVDRIYRGTRANDTDPIHGVFTKDMAYFEGFQAAANFVAEGLASGVSIGDIIAYLQQGKIDATNSGHREALERAIVGLND